MFMLTSLPWLYPYKFSCILSHNTNHLIHAELDIVYKLVSKAFTLWHVGTTAQQQKKHVLFYGHSGVHKTIMKVNKEHMKD